MQEQGFSLLGGCLLPGDDGPLAQLMYESPNGERLTLTVKHAGRQQPETGFQLMEKNGNTVFYWIDQSYGYALSGSITKARACWILPKPFMLVCNRESRCKVLAGIIDYAA